MDYKEYDTKPQKRTRTEVFMECVKKNWKSLLIVGLLLALSLIPIVTFRFQVILHRAEMNEAVKNEIISESDAFLSVTSLRNMFYMASFVLAIPVALIAAGISKAIKCLSWREMTSIKDSFGEGIKENWLYTLLTAILNIAYLWCVNFVSNVNTFTLAHLPATVYLLAVLPWSMWIISANAIYRGTFLQTFKNSFVLMIKTYPLTVIMSILVIAPLLLLLLPFICLQVIVPFIYAIYIPFVWLVWVLFTNAYFDKYININSFPDLVDRGLK